MISPGTERALQKISDLLPKLIQVLEEKAADPTVDEITIPITLTREEWSEAVNAISIRAIQIEREGSDGDMSDGDVLDWVDTLNCAYGKITKELDRFKINY
jgi:hypothetical protein